MQMILQVNVVYIFQMAIGHHVEFLQVALLWQTRLSVEILQLTKHPI